MSDDMSMLSPSFLDSQSKVSISRWVDVDSEECREIDEDYAFTKKILRFGFESNPFLFLDSLGRVWGRGNDGEFWPLHFERGKELIGYRIASKAVS